MKFVHIGCWNYKNFLEQESDVSNVLKSLNNYSSENLNEDKDFIVIAGDNYYPNLERYDDKDTKWINIDEMLKSFDDMPKNIKKYLLFGNNDINDKTIIDNSNLENIKEIFKDQKGFNSYKNITQDTDQMKTCRLVDIELLYTKNKNYRVFNGVMYESIGNNLIIMIDTSIYDDEIYNESVQCYKRILNTDYNKDLTLEELIKTQNESIFKLIESKEYKNVILIGHHPISGLKQDDENNKNNNDKRNIFYYNEKLVSLMKEIFKKTKAQITYLCSHIHMYQSVEINIDDRLVRQYICGCGGACLDHLSTELENKKDLNYDVIIRHKDIYLRIDKLENNAFGYLVVNLQDNDEIKVEFIRVKGVQTTNYRTKYYKYKSKYDNLLLIKNKNK